MVSMANFEPATSEEITISTTAVGLTTIPAHAMAARIQVQKYPIRYGVHRSAAPTATAGYLQPAWSDFTLDSPNELRNFKAIRDLAATADVVLRVTYYL